LDLIEFSKKYFEDYLWNDENNIIYLLQENEYLKKNSFKSPKNSALELIDKDGNVLKPTDLKKIVQKLLDDYYTWDEARDKSKLKEDAFINKLVKLGYYDDAESTFTNKAFNQGIVTSFSMFTYDGIQKIIENSFQSGINNVAMIQWIGPFNTVFNNGDESDLSVCENWINKVSESPREYNFYYIQGYLPGKGNGTILKYYIGKTERYCLIDRLKQPEHKISKLRADSVKIWIGRFSDYKLRSISSMKEKNEDEHEKEIHNLIENTEWGLIHGFITKNSGDNLLNDKKINEPKFNTCVINKWYKPTKEGFIPRTKQDSGSELIPDVIMYTDGVSKILDRV